MDQSAYTVEELLTDESFLAYVLRTDQEAVRQWENRLRQHPEQAPVIEEASHLIRLMAFKPEPIADAAIAQEVQKLETWLSSAPVRPISAGQPVLKQAWGYSWLRVAASLLFLLVPAVIAWMLLSKPAELLAYQTSAGESTVVVLPDSSVVFLSGNSTPRYPSNWQGQPTREVWLEGEAFFHVQPKPVPGGVKFLVHAAHATVEVLGTRFNVWNRDQKTKVVLSSGKVKVNVGEGDERQPVFMEPGEMVELSASSPKPLKSKVTLEEHPAQKEKKIVFQDAPIRQIALVVKEYYDLKVKLHDSSIADLKISGTLPTNNEESFFKALAIILDLEITKGTDKEVIFKRNHNTNLKSPSP
ncbi:pyoverdine signaling pathway anti-sigma factor FpvR [soil metagenome]